MKRLLLQQGLGLLLHGRVPAGSSFRSSRTPACWHLLVPKPHVQEQVHQKEAKDFSLALLLLQEATATSLSVAPRL